MHALHLSAKFLAGKGQCVGSIQPLHAGSWGAHILKKCWESIWAWVKAQARALGKTTPITGGTPGLQSTEYRL